MKSQHKYDLAVAYRIYPKPSSNPSPIFYENKLQLAELCLESFKNSLGNLRVKVWALLNDCPPEFEALFTSRFPPEDTVLVRFPGIGPGQTLYEQFRILTEQTDAELVLFSEDDYFYLPGQLELGVDFLKQNADADFVTPYDCPDFHLIGLHKMPTETREFGGKKWTSRISATHTFMAKHGSLQECKDLFDRMYAIYKGKTSPDLAMWMALTKKRVFNPFKFVFWTLTRRWWWVGNVFLAWVYCWRDILFGRKFTLWAPEPSIATHMSVGLESLGVDWQQEFQKQLAAKPFYFLEKR